MGSFGGHILPGSFFMLIALWHLVQIPVSYFRAKRRHGPPFRSSTYYASSCCPRIPVESLVKVIITTIGLIIEVAFAFVEDHFVHLGNGQHICMYAFFGLTGFMEILEFYRFHMPGGLIYAFYSISFFIEAMLFYWHLHVQDPLEVQVHTLLIYVNVITIGVILAEMKYRHHILPALARTFLILFHGLWFWQVAFILYPPPGWAKWDWHSHEEMMLVTIIFCADVFLTLLFCMLAWFIIACLHGSLRLEPDNPNGKSQNGYAPAPQAESTGFQMDESKFENQRFAAFKEDDEDVLISE